MKDKMFLLNVFPSENKVYYYLSLLFIITSTEIPFLTK